MHKIILIIALLFSYTCSAQSFELEGVDHPFHDIIEWKGMGALLLSKDPSGNSKQINITLVGNQTTSIWDQKFTPKSETYYYITSENARYVYFIDDFNLNNGKIYFNQLNSAGNVKATSAPVAAAIKKVGPYNPDDCELINVVATDKALTFHYRYQDKKNKNVVEIAVFMTHHNFLCYGVELGSVPFDNLKDEKYGHWEYIGFSGDQIYFAARDYQNKNRGWTVREFTSKGKAELGIFLKAPSNELIPIENIGFGTTGKYYLKDKLTVEKGLLTNINGKFYMVGAQRKSSSGAEITLFELENDEWKELNSMHLNYFIEKKNLKLGIYPMNEGVGYHLDHNGYNKVSLISYKPNTESSHNDFTERTIYNPSSVFVKKEKNEFQVLIEGKVLTFDTQQLNKPGSVTFEIKNL